MSHPIPSAALDDRLGYVGTAGSGKTYNASSGVERLLHEKKRVVAVDPLGVWWGLRLNADGRSKGFDIVIFGGPHGDLPLTENAGALIGETVAGMKESCILDLSQLGTKAAERRFMLAFLTAFYRKASGEPVHVIFDEADMWAPQRLMDRDGDAARLLGMMETMVRRGRVKGFIPWLITQRPAVVSKDVLSQVDGLVAFKLTSSQDRDAIGNWVEGQADKGQWAEIWKSLPTLERGQGVIWLPSRGILKTAAFPKKATFDSSATPKRGQKVRSGAKLRPLNLDMLQERLRAVEAQAKADNPTALRADIAKLQAEKTALERQVAAAATKKAAVDPGAIRKAEERGFEQARKKLENRFKRELIKAKREALSTVAHELTKFANIVGEALKNFDVEDKALAIEFSSSPPVAFAGGGAPRPAPSLPPAASRARQPASDGAAAGALGKGERAILIAVAQHPNGTTREQLTVLTGYKRSSRDTYIQRLGAAGMVEAGERIMATAAGIAALGGDYQPLPTGAALREHVLARLPTGERKVLEVLVGAYPEAVARDALTEATGYQRSSRDTYLQRLGARELVVAGRGEARASAHLFDGGHP